MCARVSVLLVLVCLATALTVAQERGVIVIEVTDAGKSVLPGVTVTLTGPDQRNCVTNERGECAFVGLVPGTYRVTTGLSGFTTTQKNVELRAGSTQRISMELGIASLTETVTVTGESPVIDTQVVGIAGGIAGGYAPAGSAGYADSGRSRVDRRLRRRQRPGPAADQR